MLLCLTVNAAYTQNRIEFVKETTRASISLCRVLKFASQVHSARPCSYKQELPKQERNLPPRMQKPSLCPHMHQRFVPRTLQRSESLRPRSTEETGETSRSFRL